MFPPRPFDLAIVFDKNVKPEYQAGTLARLAGGRSYLECVDNANNPVFLVDGVPEDAIKREAQLINAAAVGLVPEIQNTSTEGLGYLIPLHHRGKSALTAVVQKLVVRAPF